MTSYQLWQLEKYGNILSDDCEAEEFENRMSDQEKQSDVVNHVFELELLNQ